MASVVSELQLLKNTKSDLAWLKEHYTEVLSEHDNEFVAVKNCKLIASNSSLDDLIKDLKKQNVNPGQTLIKHVTRMAIIL